MDRFPIESRGRRKKLREVGCVTAICAACFTLRAVIVAWSAIDSADADLVCSVEPKSLLNCLPCGSAIVAPQLLPVKVSGILSLPTGHHPAKGFMLLVSAVFLQRICQANTYFRSLCRCAGCAQSSFPQSDLLHRM